MSDLARSGSWLAWADHDHAHVQAVVTPLSRSDPASYVSNPSWLGYDSIHRQFYVADAPSSVDIIPGNFSGYIPTVTQVVSVGSGPFGVAFDNLTGEIFVTNSGSNNVSVLAGNDSAPVASIDVGSDPMGVSFDPTTGDVYVANNGSNNLSIISGSLLTVVGSVPVGANPIGVAADSISGQIFVADYGGSEVTIISAADPAVETNVSVGSGPYDVAIDTVADTAYITNSASENLTVIAGSNDSITDWITLGGGLPPLTGLAYDAQDGLVWVGAGWRDIAAINTSTESVEVVIGTGLFVELTGEIADFFGQRSKGFEGKLQNAKRVAFQALKTLAA
ncbi:MAG: YncE family protein, partial [Thermoplasmata archaeon]|nr:YncE family protein [Thermoplasmata archaeon]